MRNRPAVKRWICLKNIETSFFITEKLSKIMATIRTVIVPTKALKGGRHKVRVSVAHNGETRYIPTSIIIDNVREFKNGIIVNRGDAAFLNTKLRKVVQHYQDAIDELGYIDGLTCPELVYSITHADFNRHKTIKEVYEKYMEVADIADGTRKGYRGHYRCITAFIDENTLFERINHLTLAGFNKFMLERGYTANTRRDKLVFIMVLLNFAERCRFAVPAYNPFIGYELPAQEVRQSWLSVDEVKRIRDVQTDNRGITICRDMFMLCYYLGGINIVDLANVNFNECKHVLHYVRQKTQKKPKLNKFVEFSIPDEAQPIIAKYKGKDGHLTIGTKNCAKSLHYIFTAKMKELANAVSIKSLIFYAARKSFAQHAFEAGVSESVVDFILGHRVDKVTTALYSYISVTPQQASDAIRLVLDRLK